MTCKGMNVFVLDRGGCAVKRRPMGPTGTPANCA